MQFGIATETISTDVEKEMVQHDEPSAGLASTLFDPATILNGLANFVMMIGLRLCLSNRPTNRKMG